VSHTIHNAVSLAVSVTLKSRSKGNPSAMHARWGKTDATF
jgi:hypothetical protein